MHSTRLVLARLATVALVAIIAAPLHTTLRAQIDAAADTTSSPAVARDSVIPVTPIAAPAPAPVEAPVARAGAPLTGLRSAVHVREKGGPLQITAAANHANLGQARAMMVVGAAALITGAIIGGDPGTIIMVGGAVIGLYGLYTYLQ
jgi:hypothetical protein